MIVSASYRTDIPAFYAPWFMNRLAAGFCRVRNPYGGADYRVDLTPEAVDGFVLWTRNIAPLQPGLETVRQRAPFVVQFTVTGYPRPLEAAVIAAERAVEQIRGLRRDWGPRAAVWRYDPILLTSLTPAAWHLANFGGLAAALAGAVDEVAVSFAQSYRKTRRNLDAAAAESGFTWRDPPDGEKRNLLSRLAAIAGEHGMRLTICTQPELAVPGAEPSRCIDAARLGDVAGTPLSARTKGNRPGCLCAESRDIGIYDSCPHGCVYCYAVTSRTRAAAFKGAHDPDAERL
jgi:hypothetical protein